MWPVDDRECLPPSDFRCRGRTLHPDASGRKSHGRAEAEPPADPVTSPQPETVPRPSGRLAVWLQVTASASSGRCRGQRAEAHLGARPRGRQRLQASTGRPPAPQTPALSPAPTLGRTSCSGMGLSSEALRSSQTSVTRTNNSMKIRAEDVNRLFTKEDAWMANKLVRLGQRVGHGQRHGKAGCTALHGYSSGQRRDRHDRAPPRLVSGTWPSTLLPGINREKGKRVHSASLPWRRATSTSPLPWLR